MNLQPICPSIPAENAQKTQWRFACRGCGKLKVADSYTRADMDGPAFNAYYCGECVTDMHRIDIVLPM
jgi:predicted SprT family Zn-dependent metalloprotease